MTPERRKGRKMVVMHLLAAFAIRLFDLLFGPDFCPVSTRSSKYTIRTPNQLDDPVLLLIQRILPFFINIFRKHGL